MEIFVIGLAIGFIVVLVINLIDFSVKGQRVDTRDMLKYPSLEVGGTELDKYIDKKIRCAIEESDYKQENKQFQRDIDLLRLARELGYVKLEAGEWKKIDGKNKKN